MIEKGIKSIKITIRPNCYGCDVFFDNKYVGGIGIMTQFERDAFDEKFKSKIATSKKVAHWRVKGNELVSKIKDGSAGSFWSTV